MQVELAAGPLRVRLTEEDLAAAVDALLGNVFAHTPEGSTIDVTVASTDDGAVVEVADRGPGLAAAATERGHSGAGSTGLGLDIARRTAEAAGGRLVLGGTRPAAHAWCWCCRSRPDGFDSVVAGPLVRRAVVVTALVPVVVSVVASFVASVVVSVVAVVVSVVAVVVTGATATGVALVVGAVAAGARARGAGSAAVTPAIDSASDRRHRGPGRRCRRRRRRPGRWRRCARLAARLSRGRVPP